MHPMAVNACARKLSEILEKSSAITDYAESHSRNEGVLKLSRDTRADFDKAVSEFIKKSGSDNTQSLKVVRRDIIGLLISAGVSVEAIESKLNELVNTYANYSTANSVYQVVQGVSLRDLDTFKVNDVTVFNCTHQNFDAIIAKANISTDGYDANKAKSYADYVAGRKAELFGKVVMHYEVVAEPTKASELAFEAFSKIIDVFRYAGKIIERGAKLDIRLGLHTPGEGIFIISEGEISQQFQPSNKFVIDAEALELMDKLRCSQIFELQRKPVADLTNLEERVLRAIKWYATAAFQEGDHVAYLHFVLALESLFTSDDKSQPIGATISDAVAFLLSESAEKRIYLKAKVATIYGLRSSIAHGSSHTVNSDDLDYLGALTEVCITTIINKLGEIKTRSDLTALIDKKKFFGSDDIVAVKNN